MQGGCCLGMSHQPGVGLLLWPSLQHLELRGMHIGTVPDHTPSAPKSNFSRRVSPFAPLSCALAFEEQVLAPGVPACPPPGERCERKLSFTGPQLLSG